MGFKIKKAAVGVGVALFWVAVWEIAARGVGQELLLPTPGTVAVTLWRLWGTADFWISVGGSLARIVGGFAAGTVLGTALALLTTRFSLADRVLSPVLRIVRAAPVASFIILAYVWIRVQILPGFIACLMVMPPVWDSISQGIRHTDRRWLEMAQVFRLTRKQQLLAVRLPALLPYGETACITGLGLAWKSGIAAEVICCPPFAIGTNLHDAKTYLETPAVFAWTATVILLSVVLERFLRRRMNKRNGGAAA